MVRTPYRAIMLLVWILIHIGFVGLAVYSCIESRPPTREEAFPSGEMVIGVDASFPPFAVDNGAGLFGLDIDLGNALAAEMNLPVRFVNMGYDGLYDAVIDGQVDMVISALLVNPARTQEVRYTRPYFDNGLTLITTVGSPIDRMTDLPSRALALEYGSAAQAQARFWLRRLDAFEVYPYELPQYALDAVRLGEADAALVDTTTYYLYQTAHPDWQSEANRYNNAFYSIAIRIDRDATWEWVDKAVGSLQFDGRLAVIIDKWL
ncbi:MAG: ABC transporter substrate-binding protein [Anaerolineae bacterium]|nr:ABC transporter substrate-binding protein [Anaerolineae bacterium]